jgi:hypothetical protein
MLFDDVKAYINENILHSEEFDSADETKQRKAVNNAEKLLYSLYKRYNPDTNPLPIEAIAYQAVYLLRKDDSTLRAEAGSTYVGFRGVSLNFSKIDRTLAPEVIRILGRRIGSYSRNVADTYRGMYSDRGDV